MKSKNIFILFFLIVFINKSKAQSDQEKIKKYIDLSMKNLQINTDSAEKYAWMAHDIAKKINNKLETANSLNHIGLAKQFKADYKAADIFFTQALQLFQNLKNEKQKAGVLVNIGSNYYYLGDFNKSLNHFIKAITIYESLYDSSGISKSANNIGSIYLLMTEYDQALNFFSRSLKIKTALKDPTIGTSYSNIGDTHSAKKNTDSALTYYFKSIESYKKVNNQKGLGMVYGNMGYLYLQLKKYNEAIKFCETSLRIAKTTGDLEGEAINLASLGSAYKNTGDIKKAITCLEQAAAFFKETGSKNEEQKVLLDLSDAYKSNNDPVKALDYLKKHIALKDSVFSEERSDQLSELQTKYESEKKQQEILALTQQKKLDDLTIKNQKNRVWFIAGIAILIALLALVTYRNYRQKIKLNTALTQKNNELHKLNATKDKLFAIISHDLKNPLSAFRSITQSLNSNIATISKDQVHYFIKELNHSSTQLYDLLQNLLNWAILQIDSINIKNEKIDLSKLISQNIDLHKNPANLKNIQLKNLVTESFFIFSDKNCIQTILRNLISNAIKFTPNDGSITVGIEQNENDVVIFVSDTGIGISKEDLDKLFVITEDISKIGNSDEKGTGLGLILCKEMVEKLGGKINAESKPNHGSKFYFTLPFKPVSE